MVIQLSGGTVSTSLESVFDEAKSKFGEVFEQAVSAIFAVLQLNETVALLAARAEGAGIGSHEISVMAGTTMGVAIAHVLEMLPAEQQMHASEFAKRLMSVRSQLGRAAGASNTQEH